MKKIILSLALLPIFVHADGELAEQTPPPSFIEYHNRMAVFFPWHQVYERTKTDAFYAGVETWFLPVLTEGDNDGLFEAELRFGYNLFYKGRDHVTPFIGGGVIKDCTSRHYNTTFRHGRAHKHHAALPAVGYGVLGVLYDHEFNTIFNLGINLKGMVGGGVNKKHFDWGNPVVGFDVAVPITFRFGHKRHWDFRIEPFDVFLHGTNGNANYYGLRNTLGYRF